jgi:uncharacterized protein
MIRTFTLSLLLAFAMFAVEGQAFEVPALTGPVVDNAGIIKADSRQALGSAIRALKEQGGTQLVVLTVPTIDNLTIEQASMQVADAWKLGSKKGDEGVLLMLAAKERRVRIEVGQGLEGQLTDIASKRIIEDTMIPLFREGRFSDGIVLGVFRIAQITNPDIDLAEILEGRVRRNDRAYEGAGNHPIHDVIILIVFVLIFGFSLMSRFLFGGRRSDGFFGGGGGFGGGGFGGGGGGFGGGGGGFSGGGSSGGW